MIKQIFNTLIGFGMITLILGTVILVTRISYFIHDNYELNPVYCAILGVTVLITILANRLGGMISK